MFNKYRFEHRSLISQTSHVQFRFLLNLSFSLERRTLNSLLINISLFLSTFWSILFKALRTSFTEKLLVLKLVKSLVCDGRSQAGGIRNQNYLPFLHRFYLFSPCLFFIWDILSSGFPKLSFQLVWLAFLKYLYTSLLPEHSFKWQMTLSLPQGTLQVGPSMLLHCKPLLSLGFWESWLRSGVACSLASIPSTNLRRGFAWIQAQNAAAA